MKIKFNFKNLFLFIFSFVFFSFLTFIFNFYFLSSFELSLSLASVSQASEKINEVLKPLKASKTLESQISAKSFQVSLLTKDGKIQKILFKKPKEKRAIASLTKLMTAVIVQENISLNSIFEIKEVLKEDNFYNLTPGLKFRGKDLLYMMLIASNNTSAQTLAESIGLDNFITLMQKKASSFGMKDTLFVNPTGLDPDFPDQKHNFSTAEDLTKLLKEILKDSQILKILATKETKVVSQGKVLIFNLKNTNELLGSFGVIAGKTGSTPLAGECLALIAKGPFEGSYFLIVILGSKDRFADAKVILNWLKKSFKF